MQRSQLMFVAIVAGGLVAACVGTTLVLAPGADQVKVTRSAADVDGCTAVGNVKVPMNSPGLGDLTTSDKEFRNQVVGFGGNAGFVTGGTFTAAIEGVAYRCP
jgi:hypothetical protein